MTVTALPRAACVRRGVFMEMTELIISNATSRSTATTELSSGISVSCIGIAAISESRIVITSSDG